MDESTLAMLVVNALGWAAIAGVGWSRLGSIRDRQQELVDLPKKQNSRIDKLESWRARQEGWQEGYGTAKDRYQDGDAAGAPG